MTFDEVEDVFRPLLAHYGNKWTPDGARSFMDLLLRRDYRIAVAARDRLLETWRGRDTPSFTAFLELYQAEGRRLSADAQACGVCGGAGWVERAPDQPGRQLTVERCSCLV